MSASGRPPGADGERSTGGRPAPPETDLAGEIAALAELLAEVVQLAGQRAVFTGYWEQIAEQAMQHPSVRAALAAMGDES